MTAENTATLSQRVRTPIRAIKRAARIATGRDVLYWRDVRLKYQVLGNDGAQFAVHPDSLNSDSVVYSFGIGTDISFDLQLMERFGLEIHAFDPTPRSLKWLETQQLPERFRLHKYGVAKCDGVLGFAPPLSPNHVSHSAVRSAPSDEIVFAPVRRIGTIMSELGHTAIDLFKMDIEGGEYDVIDDMLASSFTVRQLCVEFHHRWPEVGVVKTRRAVEALQKSGYRIFRVSADGDEYSFIGPTGV